MASGRLSSVLPMLSFTPSPHPCINIQALATIVPNWKDRLPVALGRQCILPPCSPLPLPPPSLHHHSGHGDGCATVEGAPPRGLGQAVHLLHQLQATCQGERRGAAVRKRTPAPGGRGEGVWIRSIRYGSLFASEGAARSSRAQESTCSRYEGQCLTWICWIYIWI